MKYRKKPQIVEAYQFHNRLGPQDWPDGWLDAPHSIIGDGHCRITDNFITLNLDAESGDWIIKDANGCFHVNSDNVFRSVYEPE